MNPPAGSKQQWETKWKMEFHPEKCQLLTITNKKKVTKFSYNIHNVILEETTSAKYLGVVIDNRLKWKDHYKTTSKKAEKTLAFLRRNLGDCPTNIKSACYQALVRPVLEYGSVVWDPHYTTDIVKFEKIQKRAARFATGNYALEPGNTKSNMKFESVSYKVLNCVEPR